MLDYISENIDKQYIITHMDDIVVTCEVFQLDKV